MTNRPAHRDEPGDGDLGRAHEVRDLLEVPPGPVDLSAVDPRATPGLPDRTGELKRDPKAWSRAEVARLGVALAANQQCLFARAVAAGDARRLLVVLQALDCGGKDGTIKNVIGTMNPQGVRIKAFGPPTTEERKHDFLWRIRRALPEAGLVGVFNRSHYEDVLVARVRKLVPAKTWRARFEAINEFEADLQAHGYTIVKVMLHISYDEQRRRLLERLTDATKRWKFNPADLDDRRRWHGLPGGVRGRHRPVLARRRPLARGAGGPEVVPELGRGEHRAGRLRLYEAGLSRSVELDIEKLRKQLESDNGSDGPRGKRRVNKR